MKYPIILAAVFCFGIVFVGYADDVDQIKKIDEVKSEISLLNLLNGLYLSNEQLDQIIPLAEKAAELRRQQRLQLEDQGKYYHMYLSELRDALYSPTGADDEIRRRVSDYHWKLESKPGSEISEKIGQLEEEMMEILTDAQVAIIEGFNPCLFPPKNLSDPIAVGQASTTEKEEKLLEVIYRMPENLYQLRKRAIANRVLAQAEQEKGKIPDDVKKSMRQSYIRKMDGIRQLSKADFELRKKQLARSFTLFDDTVTYHHGYRRLGKISRYLLTEQAAVVLKKWREARANDPAELHLDADDDLIVNVGDTSISTKPLRDATEELIKERRRMGLLTKADMERLRGCMTRAMSEPRNENKYLTIKAAIDELNSLEITERSVDSLLTSIEWLCRLKNLRDILNGRAEDDITGLSAIIAEGRDLKHKRLYKAAYTKLSEVTGYLEGFRN